MGWLAKLFGGTSSQFKCQNCGTELKRRAEFEGKMIGGGLMSGDMLQNMLEQTMKAAYQCKKCGHLLCRACVPSSGGCPSCHGDAFDSV